MARNSQSNSTQKHHNCVRIWRIYVGISEEKYFSSSREAVYLIRENCVCVSSDLLSPPYFSVCVWLPHNYFNAPIVRWKFLRRTFSRQATQPDRKYGIFVPHLLYLCVYLFSFWNTVKKIWKSALKQCAIVFLEKYITVYQLL